MKKAINFDLNTKRYIEYTHKPASSAYFELNKFFKSYNFEHRQGSGYTSKSNISKADVVVMIRKMSYKYDWLSHCAKQVDVTNIGKQYSMLEEINAISKEKEKNKIK